MSARKNNTRCILCYILILENTFNLTNILKLVAHKFQHLLKHLAEWCVFWVLIILRRLGINLQLGQVLGRWYHIVICANQ